MFSDFPRGGGHGRMAPPKYATDSELEVNQWRGGLKAVIYMHNLKMRGHCSQLIPDVACAKGWTKF